MIHRHKQSVVLLIGLLLIAAQLASLVHAAEHPFHAEDEICAAFAAFEKHDTAIAVVSAADLHPHLACETGAGIVSVFFDKASLLYHSRAPPLHT